MIGALLVLAGMDVGQDTAGRNRFDLAQKAWECMESIQPLAAEQRVRVSAELTLLEISGEAEQLAQVITNLLKNAIP